MLVTGWQSQSVDGGKRQRAGTGASGGTDSGMGMVLNGSLG